MQGTDIFKLFLNKMKNNFLYSQVLPSQLNRKLDTSSKHLNTGS